MKQRIISTLILWTVVGCGFYFFGADAAVWILAVLTLASQYEFYRLLEKMGRRPFKNFGQTLGVLMIVAPYYVHKLAPDHVQGMQAGIIAIMIVACCLRILNEREPDDRIETLGATLLGLIYIPFMLTFLVRILTLPPDENHGLMLVVWLIATSKFCDIGALLFGKAFGRHLMSPITSPKKTWEGAFGGGLVSMGIGFSLTFFLGEYYPAYFTPLWGTLFALPIAAVSIVSDLVESMIKRRALEKDSGKFIPGIGGAFDLTDSLILAGPTGFFLISLLP